MLNTNSDFELVCTAFPMFGANIQRLWGSREFITYMKELLGDAQSASKTAFPDAVLKALCRLSEQHDQEFTNLLPRVDNNPQFKVVNESFPKIGEKISAYWGRREFNSYIGGLLHESRGDNRKGFPFETLMALYALAEQHNKEYAQLYSKIDLWTQSES